MPTLSTVTDDVKIKNIVKFLSERTSDEYVLDCIKQFITKMEQN